MNPMNAIIIIVTTTLIYIIQIDAYIWFMVRSVVYSTTTLVLPLAPPMHDSIYD